MSDEYPFEYVTKFLSQHPIDFAIQVYASKPKTVDQEITNRLERWRQIYYEIEERHDWERLATWQHRKETEQELSRQCFRMRILFTEFSKRGIAPFTKYENFFMEEPYVFQWDKLPPKLRHLSAAAERFGKYQFPAEVMTFLDNMSEEDAQALDDLLPQVEQDLDEINDFLDHFRITDHKESAHLYFLIGLLAHYNDRKRLSEE